jgi:hypothetical protein
MTSYPRDTADPPDDGGQHSNVAKDNAHVDLQVGVMHGDANFYHVVNETPEEKYRVGRNYLRGHAQQQAERLICQAFMSGHKNTEVAYYWTLAILSGRTFEGLGPADFNSLSTAFRFAERHGPDVWSDATLAVLGLLNCFVEQDTGEADPVKLGRALKTFDALPDARRAEIRRHLEMILAGGIQDRLDAEYAQEICDHRMDNDRRRRALKFFEPDPTPPRLRQPQPIDVAAANWLGLTIGTLLTGTGLVLLLPLLATGAPLPMVSTVLLCGVGGYCAVRQRWEWLRRERRRAAEEAERADIPEDDDWQDERAREFTVQVRRTVNEEFDYFRPIDRKARKQWDERINGVRNALRREVVDVYGDDADVVLARWLIRWYARETLRAWKAGALPEEHYDPPMPPFAAPLILAGVIAAGVGAGLAVFTALGVSWYLTVLATLAMVVGGCLLYPTATVAYLEWRRHEDDLAAMGLRYDEQCVAYATMVKTLEDRPSDPEVARWLDYDKAHVKMLALQRYRLANRNVTAHAILVAGTGFCRMARVPYGPPRYSSYQVHVFLLTDGGVRLVAVEVNFLNGLVHNERRMAFHYGAVATARIGEINVRPDGEPREQSQDRTGQRWIHQLAQNGGTSSGVAKPLVLSRTFRLSLVNDDVVAVRVVNFDDGLVERLRENPETMLELALDVAGLTGAFETLEAVAAEGKEWISREKDRQARRLKTYREGMGPLEMP